MKGGFSLFYAEETFLFYKRKTFSFMKRRHSFLYKTRIISFLLTEEAANKYVPVGL